MLKILAAALLISATEVELEIEELQKKRTKLLGTASLLEDDALRWQFRSGQFNETKRAYREAEACRRKAASIQERIEKLEKKKQTIFP